MRPGYPSLQLCAPLPDLRNKAQPLNIVMKLTLCNGQPVAKLSESPGKGTMCTNETFLACLRLVFITGREALVRR